MAGESQGGASMRAYVAVWGGLLVIVAVEVALTVAHVPAGTLVGALLVLAMVEAAIALLYFMHLKYERRLFWALIPALVFVLVLMDHFWPDALRLMHQRLPGP